MPQLYTFVAANDVRLVKTSDVTNPVPAFPEIITRVNPEPGPIGIVRVFTRLHIHTGFPYGTHEVDVVVLRASDGSLIGGVALDSDGQNANFNHVSSKEQDFEWSAPWVNQGDKKLNQGGSSYFRLNPGDAVQVQIWAFSSLTFQARVGSFVACIYGKLDVDGLLI